jgi:hypothetical protein
MRLLIGLFLLSLMSCSEQLKFETSTTKKVVYKYNDASVAPEYHRSFEISTFNDHVTIVVDSYGDILKEKEYAIDEQIYSSLIELINSTNFVNCDVEEAEPCDGGTSESLFVYTNDKVHEVTLDKCGSAEYPSSCGDIDGIIKKIKSLIPSLEELLQ